MLLIIKKKKPERGCEIRHYFYAVLTFFNIKGQKSVRLRDTERIICLLHWAVLNSESGLILLVLEECDATIVKGAHNWYESMHV